MAEIKETRTTDIIKAESIPQDIFTIDTKEFQKRRAEAFKRLINGKTPLDLQKERPGRGGTMQRYVDIGYMTEQANLLTRYSWQHEILEERERTNSKGEIVELGALVKVTIGNVSHTSWGQKDVARYSRNDPDGNYKAGDIISLFDDKKAAISDGIKKCLSYFGIAADVYANKELEFYLEDLEAGDTEMKTDQSKRMFNKYIENQGLAYSKVFEILGVKNLSEITDFTEAYKKVKGEVESVQ